MKSKKINPANFSASLFLCLCMGLLLTLVQHTVRAGKPETAENDIPELPREFQEADDSLEKAQEETEITSDQGSMDFATATATFKGNVKVIDQDAVLTSDELIVKLNQDNQIETMEARGNVVIHQPRHDRIARAGHAHYTAGTRTVILRQNPSLQAGKNILRNAAKIIYYMDSERITTEPGTGERTTVIIPRSSSTKEDAPLPPPQPEEEKAEETEDE